MEAVATYGDFRYVLAGEEAHLVDASGAAAMSTPVRRARAASAARGIALTRKTESAEEPGPLRDARLEARATTLVERYFGLGDPIIPNADDDAVGNLLFGGLPEFRALGEVFTTPAFDRLIRDGKPRISMGVSLAGNLIDLTVSAGDLGIRRACRAAVELPQAQALSQAQGRRVPLARGYGLGRARSHRV